MLAIFIEAPMFVLVVCTAGALITWFAADHFRDQILADSHRLVRELALRYLQIMVGLFAVFVLGGIIAIGSLFSNTVGSFFSPAVLEVTETPTRTATIDPFLSAATPGSQSTPEPTAIPTVTIQQPASDPTLSAAQSAVVGNTNFVGVNLRSEPGLESNVVTVVPEETRVTILGDTRSMDGFTWYMIATPDGIEGWVASTFLIFEDQ